jgi:hypothetical protein
MQHPCQVLSVRLLSIPFLQRQAALPLLCRPISRTRLKSRTVHLISRFYRLILPSSKPFFTLNRVCRQHPLTANILLINIILASIEHFVPGFHPYLFALNNAIAQLKVIHNQLRVAEDHIATIAARDDALVARMQEAETVVQQARTTMGRNETENRILKERLKDAESKVQRAEQRVSAAEESLANVDRLLQSPVGQENKPCYQQPDALQPDLESQEAHLQAPPNRAFDLTIR